MPENFQQFIKALIPADYLNDTVALLIALGCVIGAGFTLYFVAKGYIMPSARKLLAHFKPELARQGEKPVLRMTERLAVLAPLLFYLATFEWFIPAQFALFELFNKALYIYLYINLAMFLMSALSLGGIIYNQQSWSKDIPIMGVIQIAKLLVFIIFAVVIVAELINTTPVYLLSSLGALAAILLLIFKDTILGLVAGVQIATHRLVAHGDWIEMPHHGADGDVLEVGLHTVKVQNFDKTITTIPTYKLISESFKNWRGMSNSGGRRIKRSLLLDQHSVKFVNEQQVAAMLEALNQPDFTQWYHEQEPAPTNAGLFRAYCEYVMNNHEQINSDMVIMARQRQPDEYGLPIELYCFSLDKRWTEYERIQAGLIEVVLASVSLFDLRVYQRPRDHS